MGIQEKADDPVAHYAGIGLIFGVAIGSALGDVGAGVALGLAIGAAIGASFKKKRETNGLHRAPEDDTIY